MTTDLPHREETPPQSFDFVKSVYLDATNTIRHYDTQRATFTQIFASILTLFTSLLTAATLRDTSSAWLMPISALLSTLSVLSVLVIIKINNLISLQRTRARLAMQLYEDLSLEIGLSNINKKAKLQTKPPLISNIPLSTLWLGIFLAITAFNLAFLAHQIFNFILHS